MRLLDVGCGWGGMVRHAAPHYGVQALGVTLSRRAGRPGRRRRSSADGLDDLAEVRHLDYRDVTETGFDAVSSIGLTEHIGVRELPGVLLVPAATSWCPGGRLLNHCITRPDNRPPAAPGAFIDRYVFPDGELTGSGRIITEMQDVGLRGAARGEPARALRDDLPGVGAQPRRRTGTSASPRSGVGTARVWGLYLAGCSLGLRDQRHPAAPGARA